jgi:dihydrofolate reductase
MTETPTDSRPSGRVFIACSLDGHIADRDGGIGWLEPYANAGEDHGYEEFMDSVDGLAIGRKTYETALSFPQWPYAKPVFVMSRTLSQDDVPEALRDRVEMHAGSPVELLAALGNRGMGALYVDGGQVIQAFLDEGLIDELTVSRVPVLLGGGPLLFGPMDSPTALEHVETRSFPSGLVQSRYAVRRIAG